MTKSSYQMKRDPQSFTKSEIVRVHMTLFYLKTFFESAGFSNHFFHKYNSFNIYLTHIHREKHRHIIAINYLARGSFQHSTSIQIKSSQQFISTTKTTNTNQTYSSDWTNLSLASIT
jgi:hypothetical protein